MLDRKNFPNAILRLKSACVAKYMIFSEEEKKYLSKKNRLICTYGELNCLLEKFENSRKYFTMILNSNKSSDTEKAIANIGIGICLGLEDKTEEEEGCYKQAMELAGKTTVYGDALIRLGCFCHRNSQKVKKSLPYFREYLTQNKKGRHARKARYNIILALSRYHKMPKVAEHKFNEFKKDYPESNYTKHLAKILTKDKEKSK